MSDHSPDRRAGRKLFDICVLSEIADSSEMLSSCKGKDEGGYEELLKKGMLNSKKNEVIFNTSVSIATTKIILKVQIH